MAMMTGRVLLVCALCVLWCGAGGGCEEVPADPGSDASSGIERDRGQSQDLSLSETPGSHTPGPETLATNFQQEEVLLPLPAFPQTGAEGAAGKEKARKEDVAKEIGKEEKVGETGKGIQKPEDEMISVKGQQSHDKESLRPQLLNGPRGVGTVTPSRDSLPVNTNQRELSSHLQPPLPNSSPHVIPSSISAGGRGDDKSHENGNDTKNSQQPVVGDIQEKDTSVKDAASTGGEENSRLSVTTLEEMSDATKKGDSESSIAATAALRSAAGTEGTPTANHPSQPSTEGATPPETTSDGEAASADKYDTVPQSAGSTTAPTTNAKTGDTAKPGDSDGSTTASHTTSPLLLLVVACAAAAVVAA
ncbi:Mucin-associated surface protein (MASP), subgroup S012 [Trypanosoma cruzi]|nr:Mucin-associated surface protein (MASP), subgroup S012 [Trypanosoma cruzi]